MLGEFRGAFWGVAAFSLAINVLLLAPALYMLQIYDRVLGSRNELTLYLLTLVLLGLLALEALLEVARSKVLLRCAAALELGHGPGVFEAAFERYLRTRTGNPAAALADLGLVRQLLTSKGLFAFFDAPWTPVYVAVMFLLHPWLGIFGLASIGLLLALAWLNERATAPALAQATALGRSAGEFAESSLRNADAIAAHGMLARLRERWLARHGRFLALHDLAAERTATVSGATRFFRAGLQSAVLGMGALLVLDHALSPGGMIAASILLGRALSPVDGLIATWRAFVPARQAYARLKALLAGHASGASRTALPRPRGEVVLEQVVLAAPGKLEPVLRGACLRAAAGTLVAVVGASASGKSTLARALVGVWVPAKGAVRLDGVDVAQWRKEELGAWIGYLPQDVELFDGTIAENIARFGPRDDEAVVAAARKAAVHELVLRLPEGYDTRIGERGTTLSAGQRQRVALARALYGDPALIVLDEPNANLDEAGDEALIAALRQLKREARTVFIITHRANILAVADTVAMIAAGAIHEHAAARPVRALFNGRRLPAVAAERPA